jgi:SHAQKYF class myb-like DNA-binding protein
MNGAPVENSSKTEADFTKKTYKKFFIQKFEKSEKSDSETRDPFSKSENEETSRLRSFTWEVMPAAAGEEKLLKKKRSQTESDHTINSPSVISDSGSGLPIQQQNFNIGRWTEQEHKKFLEAILMFGNEWKKVQKYISTRSSTQARSHAQKFFLRLKKNVNFNEEFGETSLNGGLSCNILRPLQTSYAQEIRKSKLFFAAKLIIFSFSCGKFKRQR